MSASVCEKTQQNHTNQDRTHINRNMPQRTCGTYVHAACTARIVCSHARRRHGCKTDSTRAKSAKKHQCHSAKKKRSMHTSAHVSRARLSAWLYHHLGMARILHLDGLPGARLEGQRNVLPISDQKNQEQVEIITLTWRIPLRECRREDPDPDLRR